MYISLCPLLFLQLVAVGCVFIYTGRSNEYYPSAFILCLGLGLREFYAPSSPQARWRNFTFLSGFMVSGVDKMQYNYMQLRRI